MGAPVGVVGRQNVIAIVQEQLGKKETVGKIAKIVQSIIAILKKALSNMSEGLCALGNTLKTCISVLDFSSAVDSMIEWANGNFQTIWKTLSKLCATVSHFFSSMIFLESFGLIELGKIGGNKLKELLLSPVLPVLNLLSSSFSIVDTSVKIHEARTRIQAITNNFQALAHPAQNQIQAFELERSRYKVELGINILALVNDIAKIAMTVLAFIGVIVGGFLAPTGIPMLAFGIFVALIGLYKCFHDRIAPQFI